MNHSLLPAESSLGKVELLALVLDVLQAAELELASAEAEYDYIQALDLTADALNRLAEAKRHSLAGLPGMYPQDLIKQHIKMLRARHRLATQRAA